MDPDHILLDDGRRLDVRVSGPAEGLPLLFHHGTPGCALRFRAVDEAVHARGMRLVTWSRPGYGSSSRREGRQVVDAAADADAVLDAIGASACVVAGWSGGGPHALACGARLSRAQAVLVLAGVAPFDADGIDWMEGMGQDNLDEFGAAVEGSDSVRRFLEPAAGAMVTLSAHELAVGMESLLPEVDRAALAGGMDEELLASMRGALAHGVDGWVDDDLAFTRPWGFELSEVRVPVTLWQGSTDLMVPVAHGKWQAAAIGGSKSHLLEATGHISLVTDHIDHALEELEDLASGAR